MPYKDPARTVWYGTVPCHTAPDTVFKSYSSRDGHLPGESFEFLLPDLRPRGVRSAGLGHGLDGRTQTQRDVDVMIEVRNERDGGRQVGQRDREEQAEDIEVCFGEKHGGW